MFSRLTTGILASLILAAIGVADSVQAEDVGPGPVAITARGREQSFGIKYNPSSKSYFEYRVVLLSSKSMREGPNWSGASEIATASQFNGVPGRLAVVNTAEIHDFLLKNFRIQRQEVWIGLQVMCENNLPVWVDGSVIEGDGFAVWDLEKWYRNPNINCNVSRIPYMGVYYKPPPGFFRWQAAGWAKRFSGMMIEYPTGKP